ncbi:MAG: protein kinase [Kofleriaceae bacterium]|nr:protein kinase [Kofleriaceae bacterium]
MAEPAPPPPELQTDLLADTVVGEYKIQKKIGEGGMGAVYSAMHPMIGKRAAIKVISAALSSDASAVQRFVHEAQSVNQIGHPNIVDVFAFGALPDGRNYFVMEYLQGESLADRLHRGALPLGEALEILDQVCDALEAAHEKQIVHRDLKPDNVYLAAVRGNRTMVKLLDFGIAKLSVPDGPGSQGGIAKTRTGMMMGTPGYISPEQARGKNVDYRTDIYALGAMAFEIVTGRLPFVADNAMDIVLAHMVEPPPRPSSLWAEIPPTLDDLIYAMLNKDAAQRPSLSQARAVFSELVTSGLVTLAGGRGVAFGSSIGKIATPAHGTPMPGGVGLAAGTRPATTPPPTSPPVAAPTQPAPKKKTGLIVGVLASVLVLGGGGAFLATQTGGDDKKAEPVAATDPVKAEAPKVEPPKADLPKADLPKADPPKVDPPKADPPNADPPKAATPAGTLVIEVNVDKATVTVDGNPVTLQGRKANVPVDAEGNHVVVVHAQGREPFEHTVEVKGGATVPVVAKLERAKAGSGKKPPPPGTGKKPPGPGTGTGVKPPPGGHKDDTIDPFAN